ncbi:carboxypeptidase regulatory-like domain-containing protein [Candidatus Gottesmanbacteria bacterium]|nr:carboxypeptidase regulatory-like domain-containing protein [Candidatus Gottesmanbacteria bacterium]
MLAQKPQEQVVRPTVAAEAPEEARVKIVTPTVAPKIGMPKPPTIANTPSGIVKTQKGAILPGILVEIRNQEGTPVRALKTGKLGQFAVSTPLPSGTYTIYLEDPQKTYYFDIIEIALTGEIVSPLEIFAKTQKDKMKEELRKKLFSPDSF